jgi:hypothetical protein
MLWKYAAVYPTTFENGVTDSALDPLIRCLVYEDEISKREKEGIIGIPLRKNK